MAEDKVTKIRVGPHAVGIVGLLPVLEEIAKQCAERRDEEIQAELVRRLSKRNYIPQSAESAYREAFLREFNKYLKRPYAEAAPEGLEVKVLGPGCARCNALEQMVMEVMAEQGLAAGVEHVTDVKEIAEYGVMGTPALVINGKVLWVGSVPTKEQLMKWLREL